MNWKSTAVVSGAGLLSMWFAASPPSPAPPTAARSVEQMSAGAVATASDIERQAARLQARLRTEAEYRQPSRNLFRFGARVSDRPAVAAPPSTGPEPVTAPAPPPVMVSLSGVATDQVGDRTVRTAVLSSPSGVLLVREGDDVLGQYRVERIGEDAVELKRLSDGATLRLTLKTSNSQ